LGWGGGEGCYTLSRVSHPPDKTRRPQVAEPQNISIQTDSASTETRRGCFFFFLLILKSPACCIESTYDLQVSNNSPEQEMSSS
jgi:hypothetical protein